MSLAERHNPQPCDACQVSSESADYGNGGLCPGCHNVFRAARVLLQHDVAAEEELIPTLVFARIAGRARDQNYEHHYGSGYGLAEESVLSGSHPALEITGFVDRVPVVRVKPFAVSAERHPGTQVLKRVRIRTLSKHVRSPDVAKSYEQLLEREGAQWDENNHGDFFYHCLHGYLELTVAEGSELAPRTVEGLGGDPLRHPAFHFPPPRVTEGVHEAMKRAFANRLDLYGKPQRKTADTLVPAFTAWHIGGRADEQVPPSSRTRVSKILNQHLLEPCSLQQLPESSWSSGDMVWKDVRGLLPRFILMQHYAVYPSHRS